MAAAIHIENLGKKYRLQPSGAYLSLRDEVNQKLKNIFRKRHASQDFWALKNINIHIEAGERLAVIGKNGAGKSTLLKILSRITPPSTGRAQIDGRIASLLEVGTGFHPELTGRENIYFNGAILGLRKTEINKRLEEIIAFSGISSFIDTPLKHYSSGMQLRLAFSVAAHLEPEILLVDEVLAVGDMEFQKKCIGKMEEVSRQEGRTVIFISHNMAAVRQLCTSAMVLSGGENGYTGPVQEAIAFYSDSYLQHTEQHDFACYDLRQHPNKIRKGEGILSAAMFVNDTPSETFSPGTTLKVDINYFLKTELVDPEIGIVIKDSEQNALIGLNNTHTGKKLKLRTGEKGRVSIIIPDLNLYRPGKYRVNLYFGDHYHFYENLYDAFEFTVPETDVYHTGNPMAPEWNQIYIPKIDFVS